MNSPKLLLKSLQHVDTDECLNIDACPSFWRIIYMNFSTQERIIHRSMKSNLIKFLKEAPRKLTRESTKKIKLTISVLWPRVRNSAETNPFLTLIIWQSLKFKYWNCKCSAIPRALQISRLQNSNLLTAYGRSDRSIVQ